MGEGEPNPDGFTRQIKHLKNDELKMQMGWKEGRPCLASGSKLYPGTKSKHRARVSEVLALPAWGMSSFQNSWF